MEAKSTTTSNHPSTPLEIKALLKMDKEAVIFSVDKMLPTPLSTVEELVGFEDWLEKEDRAVLMVNIHIFLLEL